MTPKRFYCYKDIYYYLIKKEASVFENYCEYHAIIKWCLDTLYDRMVLMIFITFTAWYIKEIIFYK